MARLRHGAGGGTLIGAAMGYVAARSLDATWTQKLLPSNMNMPVGRSPIGRLTSPALVLVSMATSR